MPPKRAGGREEGLTKPDRKVRARPTDPEVPGGETGKELAGLNESNFCQGLRGEAFKDQRRESALSPWALSVVKTRLC